MEGLFHHWGVLLFERYGLIVGVLGFCGLWLCHQGYKKNEEGQKRESVLFWAAGLLCAGVAYYIVGSTAG
jgi:hypothetical protein